MIERLCRAGAIAIAIGAFIDPACAISSAPRPVVTIDATGGASTDDVARVRDALGGAVEVAAADRPDVAARVLVGRTLPRSEPGDGPVFVAVTEPSTTSPAITRLDAPVVVDVESRALVAVTVAAPAGVTEPVAVALSVNGIELDRATVESTGQSSNSGVAALSFIPSRAGLARVTVTARIGDRPPASAETAVEVVRRVRPILVHETRPSWAATFVRRALEFDPRAVVTTRSVVSRGIVADAGTPPSLEEAGSLDGYDAVVVGAAERLTPREVTSLERYLRDREGVVVLLPGDVEMLSTLAPLTGVSTWTLERRPAIDTFARDGFTWSASEYVWPATWPATAEPLTNCLAAVPRCPVWRRAVGGGRVIVSSALDGWRTRATADTMFGEFWRARILDEAAATPEPVAIDLAQRIVEPGELVTATIDTLGDGEPVLEWQDTQGTRQAVRVWRDGARRWRAQFVASSSPGRYRLVGTMSSSQASAHREFFVTDAGTTLPAVTANTAALEALAASRGGRAVRIGDVASLAASLAGVAPANAPSRTWHPFQAPWLIVPFAGLLAVEWWLRRRRGAR